MELSAKQSLHSEHKWCIMIATCNTMDNKPIIEIDETKFPREWRCIDQACRAQLGVHLDEARVSILGSVNGQEYEVGYHYIDLVCRKCGRHNRIVSNVIDDTRSETETLTTAEGVEVKVVHRSGPGARKLVPKRKHRFTLTQRERDRLLPQLSEKQKDILKAIVSAENAHSHTTYGELYTEIAHARGIDPSIVKRDVEIIVGKIKELRDEQAAKQKEAQQRAVDKLLLPPDEDGSTIKP
jgi:hypothetical protein